MQAHAQMTGQADSVTKTGNHAAFAGHQNQILVTHQLAYCGRHFRRDGRSNMRQRGGIGGISQQPVTKVTDGQVANQRKGIGIVGINDQTGDFIAFVRNERIVQKVTQRDVGKGDFRRHALFR